jgi:hypothetical protein
LSSPPQGTLQPAFFELRSIIASHLLDSQVELILSFPQESLEGPLGFVFVLQKEYPSEACIVINNCDRTYFRRC